MPDLRAVVIVDYQNVHLVGHGLFASTNQLPRHETLVDPLLFAGRLLRERNARQRPDLPAAVLRRVEVFRGQPSPEHAPNGYARTLAQQSQWQRDRRVLVTLRPLKYEYQRDAAGGFVRDVHGQRVTVGAPREKGVDVLCALSAVRAAQDPSVDLVIVASSDTDLAPALDEIRRLGCAKVETCCWWDEPTRRGYQLQRTPADQDVRPSRRSRRRPTEQGVLGGRRRQHCGAHCGLCALVSSRGDLVPLVVPTEARAPLGCVGHRVHDVLDVPRGPELASRESRVERFAGTRDSDVATVAA